MIALRSGPVLVEAAAVVILIPKTRRLMLMAFTECGFSHVRASRVCILAMVFSESVN
jgi:hypothetical protein